MVGRCSLREEESPVLLLWGGVGMLLPWSYSARSNNMTSPFRMKTWWRRSAAVFHRAVLYFLLDFDFYLLLCKITVLYKVFLFLLSQSNHSHVDSLLSLKGYLQLLSSQMENMLEVSDKTSVLLIDWNTVSDYWIIKKPQGIYQQISVVKLT